MVSARAAHASAASRLPLGIRVHRGKLADAAVERDMWQADAELQPGALQHAIPARNTLRRVRHEVIAQPHVQR